MSAQYTFMEVKELYSIYRDYVKHEDELINRRLSWNLTLQGFLFAAYGVSFQVLAGPPNDAGLKQHMHYLPCVFSAVGLAVAILVLMSIMAAQDSIDGLRTAWHEPSRHIDEALREALPGLTGAGQSFANRWGKVPQVGIPIVIILAWLMLLAIAVSW